MIKKCIANKPAIRMAKNARLNAGKIKRALTLDQSRGEDDISQGYTRMTE